MAARVLVIVGCIFALATNSCAGSNGPVRNINYAGAPDDLRASIAELTAFCGATANPECMADAQPLSALTRINTCPPPNRCAVGTITSCRVNSQQALAAARDIARAFWQQRNMSLIVDDASRGTGLQIAQAPDVGSESVFYRVRIDTSELERRCQVMVSSKKIIRSSSPPMQMGDDTISVAVVQSIGQAMRSLGGSGRLF